MRSIDARVLANYLLSKADVEQKKLDNLQIQKLGFLCHGWHLGIYWKPLITQPIEAWPYGPVIPTLYHSFKRFGKGPIDGRAIYYDPVEGWRNFQDDMDEQSKKMVDQVWDKYKGFTGNQLIVATHKEGTPWHTVTKGLVPSQIRGIPIPDSVILNYYYRLAMENKAGRGTSEL